MLGNIVICPSHTLVGFVEHNLLYTFPLVCGQVDDGSGTSPLFLFHRVMLGDSHMY